MLNALSVDVEEYFHASEVQESGCIDTSALPSRVELQTKSVLSLLAKHNTHATFFVVGSVAEQHPGLVREIVRAGHEIGCHSYAHQLVYNLTPDQFRMDTLKAMNAIEDACGVRPRMYRAPSYSITRRSFWALEILAELGFTHDSSIYPISHDRYGIPGFGRHGQLLDTPAGAIYEIPIATARVSSDKFAPVGGGAYLRVLPYRYTAAGLRSINLEEGQPACVYFHPWELDPAQPHVAQGLFARLRTYTGLAVMANKIDRLLSEFEFNRMTSVYPVVLSSQQQHAPLLNTVAAAI
jgi:polysaccharide deacetylase family protein (PEP-CTERM system associated)